MSIRAVKALKDAPVGGRRHQAFDSYLLNASELSARAAEKPSAELAAALEEALHHVRHHPQ